MPPKSVPRETIFALASGPGRAGIAVVRISGPRAAAALLELTRRDSLPAARRLSRRKLFDGEGAPIDDGLVVLYPAPHSFTGEDVVELHLHGGRAVIAAASAALAACQGLRPAEAGEFTRRAFDNGKLDLTEVEGLADLIAAETEAQRRQALQQSRGDLGRTYEDWRARLLRARAYLEATLDFSDEEIPTDVLDVVTHEVTALHLELQAHLGAAKCGERIREGFRAAIVGAPNAGKSSLFNRLAGREAAIVSPRPGTTRDAIEVALDLGGFPVVLVDTAGLRPAIDDIEAEGVRRARLAAAAADLIVVVIDGDRWPAIDAETAALVTQNAVVVISKADKRPTATEIISGVAAIATSAVSGIGLELVVAAITERVRAMSMFSVAALPTRERHCLALSDCLGALARFDAAAAPELAAEELRIAALALGRITGRVDVEQVLDVIFAEFCIGK